MSAAQSQLRRSTRTRRPVNRLVTFHGRQQQRGAVIELVDSDEEVEELPLAVEDPQPQPAAVALVPEDQQRRERAAGRQFMRNWLAARQPSAQQQQRLQQRERQRQRERQQQREDQRLWGGFYNALPPPQQPPPPRGRMSFHDFFIRRNEEQFPPRPRNLPYALRNRWLRMMRQMGPSTSFQLMYRRLYIRMRDTVGVENWDGIAFLLRMEPEAEIFQRMHASTVSRQMQQDINQEQLVSMVAAANAINPQQPQQANESTTDSQPTAP